MAFSLEMLLDEFPVGMIFHPGKRLFWGSLLGSVLLILLISGRKRAEHLRTLVSPAIWFHRSSRADIKIILVNGLFRTLVFSGGILSSAAIAAFISYLLTRLIGPKPNLAWGLPWIMTLYSLTIFVADDFARFFLHYLQHRWRWLWVFHQTHHSALVLTPLTLYRTHPVDVVCARIRTALTYGIVTGIFFYAFGQAVSGWDILGAEALGFLFNFAGANLRHSQVWLHFGPLEGVIISPAAHQIHHSQDPEHYDRNFGVCLAIWDRLFKSFYDPRRSSGDLRFGLVDSVLSAPEQRLLPLYVQPFRDLVVKEPEGKPEPVFYA